MLTPPPTLKRKSYFRIYLKKKKKSLPHILLRINFLKTFFFFKCGLGRLTGFHIKEFK